MDQIAPNKMGTEKISKLVLSMSFPAIISMLVQALYNIVDSIFVAQLGEAQLAAVSFAFPLQMLIIAVAVGTGIGLNSLIARKLGAKNLDDACDAASHGIFLGVLSGIAFAIIGLVCAVPFFNAFTKDVAIVDMGVGYIQVVMVFSFGVFIQVNAEKTLQATGNMVWPMIFQLTGAIINIVLDPIMIFGLFGFPRLEVLGAAIATVIGQICAMLLSLFVLFKVSHDVEIKLKGFKPKKQIIKGIYSVGFPAMIMQAIGSFMLVVLNAILAGFSITAVTVFGVYFKLQSFVFMPVFGIGQGTMPIMGYNYGAQNKERLLHALRFSSIFAAIIMLVGTAIFWIFPAQLLLMFKASEQMLAIGVPALRIISISFVFAAIGIMFSNMFQAVGRGFYSLLVSVLRQLVLICPLAYVFASLYGVDAVWWAFPIAEAAACLVSVGIMIAFVKNYDVNHR